MDNIYIKGARTHNLKNISLEIPRNKIVVITGLSGSGKSSLAFDTLYAEGQRRYVESLSTYARQFLSMMEKPDVDQIEGLSPAISIEQKATSHNPRSTVGTVTEIYDYLRLLYARVGTPICPDHNEELKAKTVSEICNDIFKMADGAKLMVLAPLVRGKKGEHNSVYEELRKAGYVRVKVNGVVYPIEEFPELEKNKKHDISAVIDRVVLKKTEEGRSRLSESIETSLFLSDGLVEIEEIDNEQNIQLFSSNFSCSKCGYSIPELEPRMFSFNNPYGACEKCDGLGVIQYFNEKRLIQDEDVSISNGAIKGWTRRNRFYFYQLKCLSSHFNFSLTTAWKDYPDEIKKIILWGSKDKVDFSHRFRSGSKIVRKHKFEGIIPSTERRFKETDSEYIREELSKLMSKSSCNVCNGSRLNRISRNVFINKTPIGSITSLRINDAAKFIENMNLKGSELKIAEKILKEISDRLTFLEDVGLSYLTLERSAESLSGGEAQRIRLASQIGSGLVGVTYVLDEPSIGLHQRDNEKLIKTLNNLKDLGNTVIVVEHDEEAIRCADHIIDIGPGAGKHGGEICAEGSLEDILNNPNSITAKYLSGERQIVIPKKRKPCSEKFIIIVNSNENNLQNISASIPVGLFTCITGVSGSGKSSLINQTLLPLSSFMLNKSKLTKEIKCEKVEGLEHLDKVINIDQSPIGRTPRSNPATYTGLFSHIRDLLSQTVEARSRGYKPGRFSFNVKGGRCEACQGDGMTKVEMHFLADVYVKCDVCNGDRYNEQTLEVKFKEKNISDILNMTVEEALDFFDAHPAIKKKLVTLNDVGLGYITLGQSAITLSGGEAQRIKLAKELSKRSTGKTLFILDEPTTGLHFADIELLMNVLNRLKEQGNTIVVIEHNLDVVKTADWIIDLGPEGGSEGGTIVAEGTPEDVSNKKGSYTGAFLKDILKN
ncbi:excinuclease ABC subunit UvrA [Gammaproteobacteria bacterium]|nr:excinuclease ABC subunit UvrA [Gammaproteobacteria bacterium]MDA9044512.1 excinuclease ABC subunit UvrA [Gammaproteobacteria bacterium]MDA9195961.1 excinuclease ABC subunit UvrA [Gammaproteobacteria bacterium]MDA9842537.1 excinuclease ABC subunit UvrA [Gammaproteobacteria bacterium]MDC0587840.1 excinuclease ABC subunit UvrA [Gammaproteobacteria bacterium]|tara:strand:- start:605 stop:3430 length:2826 start_codon:yes stop_codon:yes gene_type:complete